MTDKHDEPESFSDDMSDYLQTFLDETDEQLDDLVETLLSLEKDADSQEDLNEAFRLIHSIKGSAGMMGLDSIAMLTHHLENRFERIRAGSEKLGDVTMNIVLRSIDFLRQCNRQLRGGEPLGSPMTLLEELRALEEESSRETPKAAVADDLTKQEVHPLDSPPAPSVPVSPITDHENQQESLDTATAPINEGSVRMQVQFRAGLPLSDLKAQLVVARLSRLGDLESTKPPLDQLSEANAVELFEICLQTKEDQERLRSAADVEGVESIVFPDDLRPQPTSDKSSPPSETESSPPSETSTANQGSHAADVPAALSNLSATDQPRLAPGTPKEGETEVISNAVEPRDISAESVSSSAAEPAVMPSNDRAAAKIAETMRVDIDRLDNLMNLAGELIVNRAHFVQITNQISPARQKAAVLDRIREFSDGLRATIEQLEREDVEVSDRVPMIHQLRTGLELMESNSELWESDGHHRDKLAEAVDQLTRVSHGLQQGVLDTRMVPVAPLFNRFKRVVRDLSRERSKNVRLQIRGEKTELDKRMIDELGDPLVHLVRNSIDHGLESPEVRAKNGKPEVGTIVLEASHSGNSVYVRVRDDGGGIDAAKIRSKLVDRRIMSPAAAEELTDDQTLEYIWHPGFSTADQVTDVSGRGVGMDVVRTRIAGLNGTIAVESSVSLGTTFTIRLPLTLAIINCLLVRLKGVVFAMAIDGVREIVSVDPDDVATIQGKQVFDVREELVPLVNIDQLFQWHEIDYGHGWSLAERPSGPAEESFGVVILQHGGNTLGLRVDEFLGSQDMVIKSLSDNFMKLAGLSGASILGDGSVCLMLDVARVIEMASTSTLAEREEPVS